jgi:hypothetical protein
LVRRWKDFVRRRRRMRRVGEERKFAVPLADKVTRLLG